MTISKTRREVATANANRAVEAAQITFWQTIGRMDRTARFDLQRDYGPAIDSALVQVVAQVVEDTHTAVRDDRELRDKGL